LSSFSLLLLLLLSPSQVFPLDNDTKNYDLNDKFAVTKDSRCAENEVWTKCKTCEASCENPEPDCPLVCRAEGCECQHSKGYVRHLGNCVPMEVCDSLNATVTAPPSK
uniref:TIL domain-containing protein n=1 Tax=Syphacia muris TaxID=451379 RepID=A0A0N5AFC0_9BILA